MDGRVSVCAFVEPHQGADYEQVSRFAGHVERLGFGGLFLSDHYLAEGAAPAGGGPLDVWLALAALARETSDIRLGTLMACATFRLPAPLAIAAAQVDHMSGGRLDLGIGAGWYEEEHRTHGIAFPPARERFDRLREQLEILHLLWRGHERPVTYRGRYYRIERNPALPVPRQPGGPPIIVGGRGLRRTPAVAARFADEFNIPFVTPERIGTHLDRADQECAAIGRNPRALRRSCVVTVVCGDGPADVRRRERNITPFAAAARDVAVTGRPWEVAARLLDFRARGVERVYLQFLDLDDIEHLELIAADVLPRVTGPTDDDSDTTETEWIIDASREEIRSATRSRTLSLGREADAAG